MNQERRHLDADSDGDRPCPDGVRPEKVAAARRSLRTDRYNKNEVLDAVVERLYAAINSSRKQLP